MPDIGSGLASFGQNLAEGMQAYHKEREQQRNDIEMINALSRLQLPDPVNPDKTVPVFSKEAQQLWNQKSAVEQARGAGAEAAIGRMLFTAQMAGLKTAQEARVKAAIGETGAAGQLKSARTQQATSRAQLNQAQLLQQLGVIPKVQQPPTGGQIMQEQRRQRAETYKQRKDILDQLHYGTGDQAQFLDPELLLDKSAVTYGTMEPSTLGFGGGFTAVKDPSKASHVQLQDGPLLPIKTFQRLQQKAQTWQKLGQKTAPQLSVNPQDAQKLLANPAPDIKALFDKHYGQGAADTILGATQPAPQATATPQPDDTSDEGPADEEETGPE